MENKSKDILFTFDYELFLGKSGSIEKCLIEPTNELIKVFKNNNVRATFFIDTTFLQKLKELHLVREFNTIERQLQNLVENGHRIELHLHPNWYDSEYLNEVNEWIFNDYRYYQLKNCPDVLLKSFFENGYEILTNVANKVDSNYKPIAFRAGGWCIDPFSKLVDLFKQYNIFIDSSVLPFNKEIGVIANYDYMDITETYPYRFENDVHKPDSKGKFLEIPITIYQQSFIREFFRFVQVWKLKRTNPYYIKGWGDGETINFTGQQESRISHYLNSLNRPYAFFTTDGYRSNYFINKVKKNEGPITIVGHPKVLSKQNLEIIKQITSDDNNYCNFNEYLKCKDLND